MDSFERQNDGQRAQAGSDLGFVGEAAGCVGMCPGCNLGQYLWVHAGAANHPHQAL